MRLRIMTEPQQGARYAQLRAVARAAEDAGFDAFFRSDHLLRIGPGDPGPGPTDAWVTLGALAVETSRIRLGTLVTPATFRLPGPLAVAVAQVDQMSGGRVELGLGAGWYADEHRAYGVPFPPLRGRFDRLEEQLQILRGLWRAAPGEPVSFHGHHYSLTDCPALPRPHSPGGPPIIVGGHGATRTPALAAAHAAEYNIPFPGTPGAAAAQFARVRDACAQAGRDPATLTLSVMLTVAVGRSDAEAARRAAAAGAALDDLRRDGVAGGVGEAVTRLGEYAAAGAERVYLQVLDLDDLDHLALVAAEVATQL